MNKRVSHFTLIELLVVIVIILILAAMLLPVFGQVKARAYKTSCMNQMDQFGKALIMYGDDVADSREEGSMPGWMSNLYPEYITTDKLFICPQDPSSGLDGSRPGAGWPDNGSTSIQGQTSPDNQRDAFDIIHRNAKDVFFNTDDTKRNNDPSFEPAVTYRNTDIEANSYLYEFSGARCWWADGTPQLAGKSWNEVKFLQKNNGFGRDPSTFYKIGDPWDDALFPTIRCFYHWSVLWGEKELVLNTAFLGNVFTSRLEWETGVD